MSSLMELLVEMRLHQGVQVSSLMELRVEMCLHQEGGASEQFDGAAGGDVSALGSRKWQDKFSSVLLCLSHTQDMVEEKCVCGGVQCIHTFLRSTHTHVPTQSQWRGEGGDEANRFKWQEEKKAREAERGRRKKS